MSAVAVRARRGVLRERDKGRCQHCGSDLGGEVCAAAEFLIGSPMLPMVLGVRGEQEAVRWTASLLRSIELLRDLTEEERTIRAHLHEFGRVPEGLTVEMSLDRPTPVVWIDRFRR